MNFIKSFLIRKQVSYEKDTVGHCLQCVCFLTAITLFAVAATGCGALKGMARNPFEWNNAESKTENKASTNTGVKEDKSSKPTERAGQEAGSSISDAPVDAKHAKILEVKPEKQVANKLKKIEPVKAVPEKKLEAQKKEVSTSLVKKAVVKPKPVKKAAVAKAVKPVVPPVRQPVSPASGGSIKNMLLDNRAALAAHFKGDGRVYYGQLKPGEEDEWTVRFFENRSSGESEHRPAVGDIIRVTSATPVKVREVWAITPAIGLLGPGDTVKVVEIDEFGVNKVWVRFSSN